MGLLSSNDKVDTDSEAYTHCAIDKSRLRFEADKGGGKTTVHCDPCGDSWRTDGQPR